MEQRHPRNDPIDGVPGGNVGVNPPQANDNRPTISFTKLILIAVLGGLCLFLQATVWTLELLIEERRTELKEHENDRMEKDKSGGAASVLDEEDLSLTKKRSITTVKSVELTTDPNELHLNRLSNTAKTGLSKQTQAQAWWKQGSELWLAAWDPNVPEALSSESGLMDDFTSSFYDTMATGDDRTNLTLAWYALEQAAEAGHPYAQFHVANAYSSGIFLGEVQDTWSVPESAQQQKSWLLWHMSAIGGNVEAAMAMASRLEQYAEIGSGSMGSSATTTSSCEQQLPYWEQAALGIVDALEADPQSRAKVLPISDKHVLYQIHLHGGTPSKLDYHNKADESSEALQFYHLRAMSSRDKDTAAGAAYTLGNYYHYGVRGVTQNLTLAVEYYERAANLNHWEAAGELGTFYLWGMGVDQDVYKAHKYFRMGMPLGISGCQRRYQARLKKNNSPKSATDNPLADLPLCDTESINGMGLLKLLGLPHVMKVDVSQAEELFLMARDQGSADAAYNHAMLKLGWTVHWKPNSEDSSGSKEGSSSSTSSDEKEQQTSTIKDKVFTSRVSRDHPTVGEYQSALTDLTLAAGKGHLQSRLRLGLMFSQGIQVPNPDTTKVTPQTAITKDCQKALKQYKWIAENACPYRSKRLRRAYKQYIAGDTKGSLLNYLTAAETGSTVALLNAAFLLEQGECISTPSSMGTGDESATTSWLSNVDCAKASARLWKAAANKGHGEASLRVGDFYFYRRFRERSANTVTMVGPFGYLRYFLYPEESLPILFRYLVKSGKELYENLMELLSDGEKDVTSKRENEEEVCRADENNEQQCMAEPTTEQEGDPYLQSDLEMAAHFYRLATETVDNARAHFNLGFLYEWGLGLKQDFPLAKRHYDLAVSSGGSNTQEAEIPVSIALFAMGIHEKCLKWLVVSETWFREIMYSEPVVDFLGKEQVDVFFKHLWSWESLALVVLTIILMYLLQVRSARQERRP